MAEPRESAAGADAVYGTIGVCFPGVCCSDSGCDVANGPIQAIKAAIVARLADACAVAPEFCARGSTLLYVQAQCWYADWMSYLLFAAAIVSGIMICAVCLGYAARIRRRPMHEPLLQQEPVVEVPA